MVGVEIIGNDVFFNGDDNITVFGSDDTGAGGNTVDVVISENSIKGAQGVENPTFTETIKLPTILTKVSV